MLRKIDLQRLSLEFKLPTDGTVLNLRDRLRVYLNAHSNVLYRNPRYRPLYPQHRRLPQPVQPQQPAEQEGHAENNRTPSPTPTESTDASDISYESWHGIEGPPAHHIPVVQPPQIPVAPAPVVFHDAAEHYPPPPPPPSPSVPGSDPGHFPFSDHGNGSRKFPFLMTFATIISPPPTLVWLIFLSYYYYGLYCPLRFAATLLRFAAIVCGSPLFYCSSLLFYCGSPLLYYGSPSFFLSFMTTSGRSSVILFSPLSYEHY